MDASGIYCFSDMWLFHLKTNTWCEVISSKVTPTRRYAHVSACCGTKIIIFGGVNEEGFCRPETYIVDFME